MSILAERRRFTLLDLMILIAATAIGLAIVRDSVPLLMKGYTSSTTPLIPWGGLYTFCLIVLGAGPLVAFWSLALLAIRLRSPRPGMRRLVRQPGFAAGTATVLGMAPGAVLAVLFQRNSLDDGAWSLVAIHPVGYAVAAAWLTLFLNRRWRAVPDLFDRAGRVLGVYWITTIPLIIIIFCCC